MRAYIMNKHLKVILLYSIIFLTSFIWMYSLTYNFNFFWEDSYIIGSYNIVAHDPNQYTFPKLLLLFLDTIIAPEQFYSLAYGWKPIQEEFIYLFLAGTISENILLYRFLKASLFGFFIVLSFCFFYQLKNAFSSENILSKPFSFHDILIPLLSCAYLLVLPSFWTMTLYLQDTLLLTITFATVALVLFYLFYNNDTLQNTFLLGILLFFIVFFTELSILTKHVGRLNVMIIFFFLLFTNKKKIFTMRYGILLLLLFSISFPILGFFDILSGKPLLEILGISSHMGIEGQAATRIFFIALQFITTLPYAFFPQAIFLLFCFLLFFVLHLYTLFSGQKGEYTQDTERLSSLSFFSLFWFLFAALSLFIARGFVFDPLFFTRFERSLFQVPQALFLITYSLFVYKRYYSTKKILHYVILLFLILSIGHNLIRLNESRGGWGAYFLGYDTVRQYLDEYEENALLLLPMDHSSPLYFVPPSTNKHLMITDLTNSTVLHSFQQNYSAVYIANRYPLVFDDLSIVNLANLTIKDSSPYGIFKKTIGHYYPTPMYLYKVTKD